MTHPSRLRDLLALAAFLVLSFVTAGVGAVASVSAKDFYGQLVQPSWAPPGWLFGPVWTTLFILMAVAAWLIWRRRADTRVRPALTVYGVQLAFNALWTWLFFAWQQGDWALVEIALLWSLIAITINRFWAIHRVAALLLLPYLAWVSFAAALNFSLLQLNPLAL